MELTAWTDGRTLGRACASYMGGPHCSHESGLNVTCCQVEDIETKVDVLLDMYKEDRAHQHQQVVTSQRRHVDDTERRTDDRQTSDNAHRTASEQASSRQQRVKPMLRNFSDVGPRSKKRVTYSLSDSVNSEDRSSLTRPCQLAQHKPSELDDQQLSVVVCNDTVTSSASSCV